jgi:membrane-associated phospholipid phosphatase
MTALTETARLKRRRLAAPIAFIALSLVLLATIGIPDHRDIIAVWLLLGLFAFSLSDVRGFARGLVFDWVPFFGVLVAYDSLRGVAKGLFATHYLPQLRVDQWLFGGTAPTVWLQRHLWTGHVHIYDVLATCVYITHFLATPVLAAVLWKLDRRRFRTFMWMVLALSAAGLATYALYPAAPPWMAADAGLLPHLTRIAPQVMQSIHIHFAGTALEKGYAYANNVAAVPSLHTAFALLVAYTLWPRRRTWWRPLLALYPLAMALSLVYTGEHYVSDVLLGWLYAVAAIAFVRWAAARVASRRAAATVTTGPLSAPPSGKTPGSPLPSALPQTAPAPRR